MFKVWMEEDRPPSWSGCPRKASHYVVREHCEEAHGNKLGKRSSEACQRRRDALGSDAFSPEDGGPR